MNTNTIKIGKFQIEKQYLLFIAAYGLLGVSNAVESSSLSGRLLTELGLDTVSRSFLEFPRELPGLLAAVFLGLLAFLGDIKSLAVSCFVCALGLLTFALIPSNYILIIVTLFLYSTGAHLTVPLTSSVSMTFAKNNDVGKKLGQIQALNTAVIIAMTGVLYLLYTFVKMPIYISFIINAAAMFVAGIIFWSMKLPKEQLTRSRFIIKKKYTLYYFLSVVNGARKQFTITFVPWLIMSVFNKSVSTVTLLFLAVSLLNIFFKPFLGKLIDAKGERFVMMSEAACLVFVSLGFAFSKTLLPESWAFILVSVCYVIDNMLMSVSMARSTYVRKLADTPEDVAPTLAMGMSFDHIIATTMPVFAGILWAMGGANGYVYVFIGSAVISLINLVLSNMVKLKKADSLS